MTTPELYVRWFEYGAFQPTFRSHGSRKYNEVWSYGKQAEPILEKYLRLRYTLMPYIYSLGYTTHQTGAPPSCAPLHGLLERPKDRRHRRRIHVRPRPAHRTRRRAGRDHPAPSTCPPASTGTTTGPARSSTAARPSSSRPPLIPSPSSSAPAPSCPSARPSKAPRTPRPSPPSRSTRRRHRLHSLRRRRHNLRLRERRHDPHPPHLVGQRPQAPLRRPPRPISNRDHRPRTRTRANRR